MKMEKIKKFVIEHKTEIAFATGCAMGLVASACEIILCRRTCKDSVAIPDFSMRETIRDAIKNYPSSQRFAGIFANPLSPDELGELGYAMKMNDDLKTAAFTHFVAIGKGIE